MHVRKNLLFTIFILASAGSLYGQGWTFNDGTLNVTSQIWVRSYEFGNTHPSTYNGTPYSEYHNQIKTIILADNITYVGQGAFKGCTVAERLVVGKGVKNFAYNAFYFPKSTLKTIEWNAANAGLVDQYDGYMSKYNQGPFGVREVWMEIDDYNYAANAETIIFGPDVVSIPDYFAYFMKKLKKVEFGAKVTSIGIQAFVEITPNTVIIARMPNPASVTLGSGDTYYNPFPASASDRNKITLKVPAAYINQYKAANIWKDFNIVALENSTEDEPSETQTGVLVGAFSVSSTRKVHFSRGNLQYQASTKKWRFALNQYDYIGSANSNISSTYSGWIDLFGYGTSGWNSGATYYLPTSTSTTATGYLAKDLSGSYANADWGIYNAISNGGNKAKTWRTLTYTEWNYIFKTRANATNLYSVGTVNSKPGLILLPDGWVLPSGLSFTPKAGSYSTNTYSTTQWTKMANAGAVFLPAAGWRALKEYRDTYSGGSGKRGCYQTASYYSSSTNEYSYFVNFYSNSGPFVGRGHRNSGLSVRLVVDVPTYTITWTNWDGTTLATISVLEGATPSYTGATPTRPSTAEYAYTFSGWTPAITAATANKTYTATYTATPRYTITFNANGGLIPTGGNMGNTPSGHITTLSADRTSGTVVVTKDKTHFENMANDCPSREGYTFAGWYTDPTSGVQVYDNTGYRVVGTYWNSEGKWIGTSNVTLYAHWTPIPYTITVNSSNVSQGSASGGGTYDYGTNHQTTATPNECYRFVQWSDGNTDNPRTITVTGDATYTAEFEQIQYIIEAQSADAGQGSTTITNP